MEIVPRGEVVTCQWWKSKRVGRVKRGETRVERREAKELVKGEK
jgi:hypothetical protein